MNLDNDEALSLAKEYESQVKNLKDEAYRLGWYMRGGVDVHNLLYDTDLEDFEIMRNAQNIICDNISYFAKMAQFLKTHDRP